MVASVSWGFAVDLKQVEGNGCFNKLGRPLCGRAHKKGPTITGSVLGSVNFWKLPYTMYYIPYTIYHIYHIPYIHMIPSIAIVGAA